MAVEKKCECVACGYKNICLNFLGLRYSKICPKCGSDDVIELETLEPEG